MNFQTSYHSMTIRAQRQSLHGQTAAQTQRATSEIVAPMGHRPISAKDVQVSTTRATRSQRGASRLQRANPKENTESSGLYDSDGVASPSGVAQQVNMAASSSNEMLDGHRAFARAESTTNVLAKTFATQVGVSRPNRQSANGVTHNPTSLAAPVISPVSTNIGFAPPIPHTILPHQLTPAMNASYLPNPAPEDNGIASSIRLSRFAPTLSAVAHDGVPANSPVSRQLGSSTTASSVDSHDELDIDEICSFLLSPDLVVTPEIEEEIERVLSEGPSEPTGHVETQAAEARDEIRYVPLSQPATALHSQVAASSTPLHRDAARPSAPSSPDVDDVPALIQTGGPSCHSTLCDDDSRGHPIRHQVPEAPRDEPRSPPATNSPTTSPKGPSEFSKQKQALHFSLHTEQAKKEGGFIAYSMPDPTPIELPPETSLPGKKPRLYNKKSPGWDLSGYNAQIAPQRAIDVPVLSTGTGGKRRARSEEDERRNESVGPVTKKRKSDTPRGVTAEGDVTATADTNQSLNPSSEPCERSSSSD